MKAYKGGSVPPGYKVVFATRIWHAKAGRYITRANGRPFASLVPI